MTEPDRILIDIPTCTMTLKEVLAKISEYQAELPDHVIFLDGDAHAIVARRYGS